MKYNPACIASSRLDPARAGPGVREPLKNPRLRAKRKTGGPGYLFGAAITSVTVDPRRLSGAKVL